MCIRDSRSTVFRHYHVRRDTIDTEFLSPVFPLFGSNTIVFTLDVRDHLFPGPFRRVFGCQVEAVSYTHLDVYKRQIPFAIEKLERILLLVPYEDIIFGNNCLLVSDKCFVFIIQTDYFKVID